MLLLMIYLPTKKSLLLTIFFVFFTMLILAQPYQDFSIFGINKLPAHAHWIPFQNEKAALTFDKSKSENILSLNGEWDFQLEIIRNKSREIPPYPDGLPKEQPSSIQVPSNWQIKGRGKLYYTNIKTPFDGSNPPFTEKYKNEWGNYSRQFKVPKNWQNQPVFIHFEGVQSAFYFVYDFYNW